MPNRIIKESIWTSPNLNQLSNLAERHFYRILPLPDDFGCCEVTPLVVKGRCYPLKPEVTERDIDTWQQELEDKDLIIRWDDYGRQYAIFPSFDRHQRIRSLHQRKTPIPPEKVMTRLDVICRQMAADDRLNPNPNPNPNPPSDRDDLYKILEGTKGFPKYTQENLWKLEDAMRDYPGLNYLLEFKKFKEYWNTRQLKRPWLALRNWLDKAKEKGGKAKGRGLPKAEEYEPTANYGD